MIKMKRKLLRVCNNINKYIGSIVDNSYKPGIHIYNTITKYIANEVKEEVHTERDTFNIGIGSYISLLLKNIDCSDIAEATRLIFNGRILKSSKFIIDIYTYMRWINDEEVYYKFIEGIIPLICAERIKGDIEKLCHENDDDTELSILVLREFCFEYMYNNHLFNESFSDFLQHADTENVNRIIYDFLPYITADDAGILWNASDEDERATICSLIKNHKQFACLLDNDDIASAYVMRILKTS